MSNYGWTSQPREDPDGHVLFSDNPELLNRFFNLLDDYYYNSRANLDGLTRRKQRAENLIEYFKKKYGLQ